MNLYEYRIPELEFRTHECSIRTELANPDVLGAYELQVPLALRLFTELGCVWSVTRKVQCSCSYDFVKIRFEESARFEVGFCYSALVLGFCVGRDYEPLFFFARAVLAYLPTAPFVALRPLFSAGPVCSNFSAKACAILHALCWSRQHQQVCHFSSI